MTPLDLQTIKKVIDLLNEKGKEVAKKGNFELNQKYLKQAQELTFWTQKGMMDPCPVPEVNDYIYELGFLSGTNINKLESEPGPGTLIKGKLASYRLEKTLGQGKYGFTWKASVVEGRLSEPVSKKDELGYSTNINEPVMEVVLKFANPGLTPEENRLFDQEVETLRSLQIYAQQSDLLHDGYLLTPIVFESVDSSSSAPFPKFFVISLAKGMPIDELWREKGAFAERDALQIVSQFCKVLQSLHQGVKRSYYDFQPKDIFWNSETNRIMVIDWNLLSKLDNIDQSQDLLQAGKVLYNLLMGVPAPEPGSKRTLAQPLENWKKISLSAQDIIVRAMHPINRYSDAAELQKDLDSVLILWNKKDEELLDNINLAINQLSQMKEMTDSDIAKVKKATRELSILDKLDLSEKLRMEVEILQRSYSSWLEGRGHLENGKNHFRAYGYEEARKNFTLAAEESWDGKTELEAYRWITAIAAFQEKSATERLDGDALKTAMDWLNDGQFDLAEREFARLAQQPGRQTLARLADDARLGSVINQLNSSERSRDYSGAALFAQKATDLLSNFPKEYQGYREALESQIGNLPSHLNALKVKAAEYDQVKEIIQQAETLFGNDFQAAYLLLRKAMDEKPGQGEIVSFCNDKVSGLLQSAEFVQARMMAAMVSDYSPIKKQASDQWQTTNLLSKAWNAWLWSDPVTLKDCLTPLIALPQGEEQLKSFIDHSLEKSITAHDFYRADFLSHLRSELAPKSYVLRVNDLQNLRLEEEKRITEVFDRNIDEGVMISAQLLRKYPNHPDLLLWISQILNDLLQKMDYLRAKALLEKLEYIPGLLCEYQSIIEILINAQSAWNTSGVSGLKEWISKLPINKNSESASMALLASCFDESYKVGDYQTSLELFKLMPKAEVVANPQYTVLIKQLRNQEQDRWMAKYEKDPISTINNLVLELEAPVQKGESLEFISGLLERLLNDGKFEEANHIATLPVLNSSPLEIIKRAQTIYKINSKWQSGAQIEEIRPLLDQLA